MKKTAGYPLLRSYKDYHEIYHAGDSLRKTNPKVRYFECSPEDYGFSFDEECAGSMLYYGLFYLAGNKPTVKVVKAMLDKKLPDCWNRLEKKGSTTMKTKKNEAAPDKIKVGGVVYRKLPAKVSYMGETYVVAVKGKGLGAPTGKLPAPAVGARQVSKGNSKQVPLPASSEDTAYLRGKGKK